MENKLTRTASTTKTKQKKKKTLHLIYFTAVDLLKQTLYWTYRWKGGKKRSDSHESTCCRKVLSLFMCWRRKWEGSDNGDSQAAEERLGSLEGEKARRKRRNKMRRGRKRRSKGGGGRGGNTRGRNRIERVSKARTMTEYRNMHLSLASLPTFNILSLHCVHTFKINMDFPDWIPSTTD